MKKRRKSLLVTLVLLICVFMVPTKAQAAEEYNKKIELVFAPNNDTGRPEISVRDIDNVQISTYWDRDFSDVNYGESNYVNIEIYLKNGNYSNDLTKKSKYTFDNQGSGAAIKWISGSRNTDSSARIRVKYTPVRKLADPSYVELDEDFVLTWEWYADESDSISYHPDFRIKLYRDGHHLETKTFSFGGYGPYTVRLFNKICSSSNKPYDKSYHVEIQAISSSNDKKIENSDYVTSDSRYLSYSQYNYYNNNQNSGWNNGNSNWDNGNSNWNNSGNNNSPGHISGSNGWQQYGGNWYYYSGGYPSYKNQWAFIGNSWYHFDANGKMQTGWFQDADGTYYYLLSSGAMLTGWLQENGNWYYLFPSAGDNYGKWHKQGAMARNEKVDNLGGFDYYFKDNGAMSVNDFNLFNGRYYFSYGPSSQYPSGGQIAKNTTITYNGYQYPIGADGAWIR